MAANQVGGTKQQAYDHPAYEVPICIPLTTGTLASGALAGRFAAYTSTILKAAQLTVGVAGTNTSTVALVKVAVAGTTTTTIANIIVGTGSSTATGAVTALGTTQGLTGYFSLGTTTLLQGDTVAFLNGIDLNLNLAVGIEAYLVPGASLTV